MEQMHGFWALPSPLLRLWVLTIAAGIASCLQYLHTDTYLLHPGAQRYGVMEFGTCDCFQYNYFLIPEKIPLQLDHSELKPSKGSTVPELCDNIDHRNYTSVNAQLKSPPDHFSFKPFFACPIHS